MANLKVEKYGKLPEGTLELDLTELGPIAQGVFQINVNREDGRQACFYVELAASDKGQVKCTLFGQRRTNDVERPVIGSFIDWSK